MRLTKGQRADLKLSEKMRKLLVGHVVEDEVENWMWCTGFDSFPITNVYGDPALSLKMTYSKKINRYGRISFEGGYECRTFLEGELYKEYSDWGEEAYWEVVDGDSRKVPQQWWARCPACGKRYHRTWFRQGYATKERYQRPPDAQGLDVIPCQYCSVRTDYRRWKFKEVSGVLFADASVFAVLKEA
jgi:hypothetical protein